MNYSVINKVSFYGMMLFYFGAGVNHFINPEFYLPLIPDYLPEPQIINLISGLAEMAFAVMLLFQATRRWAAGGIVLMLVAFVPAHVHFIAAGHCLGTLCVPSWLGWARLLIIHPVLIWWAWKARGFTEAV